MLATWKDIQRWGMPVIFGDQRNLGVYTPSLLYVSPTLQLPAQGQLCLLGEHLFGSMATPDKNASEKNFSHTLVFHQLLLEHKVRHVYNDTIGVDHAWFTGWVPAALDCLLSGTAQDSRLRVERD